MPAPLNRVQGVVITMARSSGKAFFTNFNTYEGSFPTKTRLALANSERDG